MTAWPGDDPVIVAAFYTQFEIARPDLRDRTLLSFKAPRAYARRRGQEATLAEIVAAADELFPRPEVRARPARPRRGPKPGNARVSRGDYLYAYLEEAGKLDGGMPTVAAVAAKLEISESYFRWLRRQWRVDFPPL